MNDNAKIASVILITGSPIFRIGFGGKSEELLSLRSPAWNSES
jgi:hypothetical protein